jgi:hypothetical protein
MMARDVTDDQRLDDPMLTNRLDQFREGIASKVLSWLQRTRHDAGETHLMDLLAWFGIEAQRRGPRAD